ncbi:MAG: hypothetical protein WCB68_17735 [Pyrinomonadaceae bacterium]
MKVLVLLFEVMDKEPTLLQIWLQFMFIGVGGVLLCRYLPLSLVVVLPIALLLSLVHFDELHDPFVGPDILREAGKNYFTQSNIAMTLEIILPCTGALTGIKQVRMSASAVTNHTSITYDR